MIIPLLILCAATAGVAIYAVIRLNRAEKDWEWLYNAFEALKADHDELYEEYHMMAHDFEAAQRLLSEMKQSAGTPEALEKADKDTRMSSAIEDGIMNILSYSAAERTRRTNAEE